MNVIQPNSTKKPANQNDPSHPSITYVTPPLTCNSNQKSSVRTGIRTRSHAVRLSNSSTRGRPLPSAPATSGISSWANDTTELHNADAESWSLD